MNTPSGSNPAGADDTGIAVSRPAGFSLRRLRTFSSFKNPVYRLYYGGMMGQMAAMNMQNLARSLLIYRLTNSAAILGIMSFANAIPMLIFSLCPPCRPGGIGADIPGGRHRPAHRVHEWRESGLMVGAHRHFNAAGSHDGTDAALQAGHHQ